MKFPTASTTPRPVRLSKELRQWAWESLHGKYGDEAMTHAGVVLDDIPDVRSLDWQALYDLAVREIAAKAPLRLCPYESIAGSATLGLGMQHRVPATLSGESVCWSVSHLTIDFERTVREGIDAYSREITERLADPALQEEQITFLHSLENVIDAMRVWHKRYLEATETVRPDIHRLLQQVPFAPARHFHEAVQALWFQFAFVRLCGNWPGIGCIDRILGPYLKQDLADGTLTLGQAREILASLFIKGCEWIQSDTPVGSGDAQHYQNIVLAGTDENGHEVANEVTYLVLDIVEELGISDYPISVRLHRRSPEKLLRKVAQVTRHGGGIVAVYNEELVMRSLVRCGYTPSQAHRFANDGCWEVQIPGETNFSYMPFDGLQLLNGVLAVHSEDAPPDFADIEALYAAFKTVLQKEVEAIYQRDITGGYEMRDGRLRARSTPLPSSVISLFEKGCIENAAGYYDGGPHYTVRSPHIGGAPDVGNSLYAIEQLVYVQKKVTLPELITILRQNWEGQDALRLYARNSFTYYGNDSEPADRWTARVLDDFADSVHACGAVHAEMPVKYLPGVSTFGRQLDWLPCRRAVAFGYRQGEILSGNASPTPGTDVDGATAIVRSYCKADLEKQSNGAALDIKIFPDTLKGENGIQALKALFRGFVELGGFFMQTDVVDAATLYAARENPEAYKTLSVRVSGWNARFVTLNRQWQDMIIERTAQKI